MIDVVLTIDIGAINTRVSLFERDNGRYHFTGTASGRTVYSDSGEIEYVSVSNAVQRLESALNRHFLDDNGRIITEGDQVVLGGNDRYTAMCHKCWKQRIKEQSKNS